MAHYSPTAIFEGSYGTHLGNNTVTLNAAPLGLTANTYYNNISALMIAFQSLLGGAYCVDWTTDEPPHVKITKDALPNFTLEWTDLPLALALGFTGVTLSGEITYTATNQPAFFFMPKMGLKRHMPKISQMQRFVVENDGQEQRVITCGSGDIQYETTVEMVIQADELTQFKSFYEQAAAGRPFTLWHYKAHGDAGKYITWPILETTQYDWRGYHHYTLHQQSRFFNMMPLKEEHYQDFTVQLTLQEYIP